jgi:hypothetical protein
MGHAGADTLNVRDILVAEPHRVWFAGRALLRGPLLRSCRQRRACERETEKRKGYDWSQIQCGANSHSGPPLVRSAPSITGNSTGVAITQQRTSGPLRPRPAPPHRAALLPENAEVRRGSSSTAPRGWRATERRSPLAEDRLSVSGDGHPGRQVGIGALAHTTTARKTRLADGIGLTRIVPLDANITWEDLPGG